MHVSAHAFLAQATRSLQRKTDPSTGNTEPFDVEAVGARKDDERQRRRPRSGEFAMGDDAPAAPERAAAPGALATEVGRTAIWTLIGPSTADDLADRDAAPPSKPSAAWATSSLHDLFAFVIAKD